MQIHKHFLYPLSHRIAVGITAVCLLFSQTLTACAEPTKEERIAANQALTIDSNEITDWPTGPVVSAESAILMEADTGTILYAKNIHKQQFPASTTKILTTLIAIEQCALDELVTFSQDAVFDIDRGSNHIAIDVGEKLTMEECLNAILIRSANEVSLAVAEHISGGSWEDFAPIMNERARELGCLNSHFVNPNGLPNEEHVTTAYDLAMIGRAFFANDTLCQMTLTPMLRIAPSAYQPDNIVETNKMELISTGKYAYEYLVGCKTGYTNVARSTLVSCAEKGGMKLICVVLKDESPYQYEDTIALFEYGFSNFAKINVSQAETKYTIAASDSFYSNNDIFGSSRPLLSLNTDACIVLPKTAEFTDAISSISYDTADDSQAALIHYTYQGVEVGSASVDFTSTLQDLQTFPDTPPENDDSLIAGDGNSSADTEQQEPADSTTPSFIFISVGKLLLAAAAVLILAAVCILLKFFMLHYHFPTREGHLGRQSLRHRLSRYFRRRQYDFSLREEKPRHRRRQYEPKRRDYLSRESSFRLQRRQQLRRAKRRRRAARSHKRDYD